MLRGGSRRGLHTAARSVGRVPTERHRNLGAVRSRYVAPRMPARWDDPIHGTRPGCGRFIGGRPRPGGPAEAKASTAGADASTVAGRVLPIVNGTAPLWFVRRPPMVLERVGGREARGRWGAPSRSILPANPFLLPVTASLSSLRSDVQTALQGAASRIIPGAVAVARGWHRCAGTCKLAATAHTCAFVAVKLTRRVVFRKRNVGRPRTVRPPPSGRVRRHGPKKKPTGRVAGRWAWTGGEIQAGRINPRGSGWNAAG